MLIVKFGEFVLFFLEVFSFMYKVVEFYDNMFYS